MTDDPTNEDRATWALYAAKAFGQQTGQTYFAGLSLAEAAALDPEVADEILGDLVADLFHLAERFGITPDALTAQGLMHYEAEAEEERAR